MVKRGFVVVPNGEVLERYVVIIIAQEAVSDGHMGAVEQVYAIGVACPANLLDVVQQNRIAETEIERP